MDRLLSTDEVAKLFCMSTRQIYQLVASGILEAVKVGRATRFFASEVERVFEKLRTQGNL